MENDIFKYKKLNKTKLLKNGFAEADGVYSSSVPVLGGDFVVKIEIKSPNKVKTTLTETETDEIYTLHLTSEAGSFVGQVRDEYEKVLNNISEKCFDNDAFKTKQANEIIKYISKKYGDELEFLWEKSPDCAIARRKESKKWYIIFMSVKKDRFGFDTDEAVEVINLHARADEVQKLLKQSGIYPAYHMNKKYWISIILDDLLPVAEIYKLLDNSYELAKK